MAYRRFIALPNILVALTVCLTLTGQQAAAASPGQCPQPRFTGKAPDDYLSRTNPEASNSASAKEGESLFLGAQQSANCAICHGRTGDGKGTLASQYDPPPRNFRCSQTIDGVPDGQLFWIIRFGSPETAMPPHRRLSDQQIWHIISFLREIAKR